MKLKYSGASKEKKAETIKEWEIRGAEWCATQLWNAKKKSETDRAGLERYINYWKDKADEFEGRANTQKELERVNERLKDILSDNGIRPTKLRLEYIAKECEVGECDADECWSYEDCDFCVEKVSVLSWYDYEITDGVIEGILSNFEDKRLNCLKIVNERTGEVLYQYETKEE